MAFLRVRFLVGIVFSFFLLLFIFINNSFAACSPPHDYSDCVIEINPEYHLGSRGWEEITNLPPEAYRIQNYPHPIDTGAPQFTALIRDNPYPAITSLYRVNIIEGFDDPGYWQDINAVGLGTAYGQQIYLPPSGYDIGGGYNAIVLFADEDSLTIKYTLDDNIVDGYTLYLEGFQVSPEIIALYNQADQEGRGQLPALDAFQILGYADREEIIVAIRDKGSFMDPRWQQDWWNIILDPTAPLPPELIELLAPPPPLPEETPADNQCSAGGSIPPSGILRPYPCKNCSLSVPQGTNSCADPFTLYKRTTWTCGELEQCGDSWLKHESWQANFTLDTRDTKVPYAGYHNVIADDEGNTDNLHNYLADYFDGTALYDGKSYDLKDPADVTRMINQAGVFRKLAPLEIQDQLRANMILSGQNYEVTDGKTTKKMQDWWPEAPMPPKAYPAGHFPPDKGNPLYFALYPAWLTTEWGRLWQRIPLFTREDSPGKVTLSIEHYPGELYSENKAGRNKSPYSTEFPMAFPHLARLHDVTQALEHLLNPLGHGNTSATSDADKENKILLAQANSEKQILAAQAEEEEEPSPPPEPEPTWFYISPTAGYSQTGSGQYQIGWQVSFGQNQNFPSYSSYDFGDFGFQVFINGQPMGGTALQPGSSIAAGPTFTNDNYGVSPLSMALSPGDSFDITVVVTGGSPWGLANQDQLINQSFQTACKVLSDGSIDCPTAANVTQVVTDPGCSNQSNLDPSCSGNNPQVDHNPNDAVCCNASVRAEVNDYRIVAYNSEEAYLEGCIECKPDETDEECSERHAKIHEVTMTRKVKAGLKIPYLENIWEDTAEDKWGIFNIFRPVEFPAFPDDDALSKIRYNQKTPQGLQEWVDWVTSPSGLTPSEGKFYFPYLGGIQTAKKCISEHFLLPPELQSEVNYCDFWDEYLKSQSSYIPDQEGSFQTDQGDQLDLMACQNASFKISDEAKASAIAKVNQSWPGNLLEDYWDEVATESKEHGWNPACVIALWIEESGASGLVATGRAKYSLGCESATSSDPAANLSQSLDCFFSRQEHEYYKSFVPGSREWWLVYAEGPGNNGVFDGPQANFPSNLFYWYQRLTE